MQIQTLKLFENINRDLYEDSQLFVVRHHVWEPDKEHVAPGLPYLQILKGWLKDSIFTRQQKMVHELQLPLLDNQNRIFQRVLDSDFTI